jgi:hypothetical protein
MAKVGEGMGDGTPIMVSVTEQPKPRVTIWCGLEQADLTPEQAEQLATSSRLLPLGRAVKAMSRAVNDDLGPAPSSVRASLSKPESILSTLCG